MPKFPTKEADVVTLADAMVAGLAAHEADFPSVDGMVLSTALNAYKNKRQLADDAQSQAQVSIVTKDVSLDDLVELMKNDLKLSEVDVCANPEKLTEIGWSPKSDPQPLQPPGSPTDLHPTAEGTGSIYLVWDKPASGCGGAVRNYVIERRQQAEGSMGPWALVTTTYNNEANLADQPDNVRLEYRVKSSNTAGESSPSNSISVVLP